MSDIEQLVRDALADAPASRLTRNDLRQPTLRSVTIPQRRRSRTTWSIAAAVALVITVALVISLTDRGKSRHTIGPAVSRTPSPVSSTESPVISPPVRTTPPPTNTRLPGSGPVYEPTMTETRIDDFFLGMTRSAVKSNRYQPTFTTQPSGCATFVSRALYTVGSGYEIFGLIDNTGHVVGLSTTAGTVSEGVGVGAVGVGSNEAAIRGTYSDAREITTFRAQGGWEVLVHTAAGNWIGFGSTSHGAGVTTAAMVLIGTKDYASEYELCIS